MNKPRTADDVRRNIRIYQDEAERSDGTAGTQAPLSSRRIETMNTGRVPSATGSHLSGDAPDGSSSLRDVDPSRMNVEQYAQALQVALTGLARGGSEFFVRCGDGYRADIAACVARVRDREQRAHKQIVQAVRAKRYVEDRRDYWLNEAQRLALVVRSLGGDPDAGARASDERRDAEDPKGLSPQGASAVSEADAPSRLLAPAAVTEEADHG